ncbi:hypothetical protein KQX54_016882 [Cotesia glomerata]|uniref:Uncharacterized protein n=1 Tax=Cotesia glomerata TaxID=32391 RepID=A0AAV7ICL8_COTGL|nr:hypothetical protein KQX54_016882 [Cotesia glomerata]
MRCRYKGKLTKKNIAQWKKNVIASNKARKKNKENAENTNFIELSGRRLVDLKLLDNELMQVKKSFDCPTLLNFIRNEGLLNEFSELVAGFADSLPLFKSKLKDKRGTKASYRQEVLAEEFLNASLLSDAHNAANDVCVLQKLVEHKDININRNDILENFKSLYEIMNQGAEKIKFNKIQKTLQCLLVDKNKKENGGLSVHMIKKMAMTGITFDTKQDHDRPTEVSTSDNPLVVNDNRSIEVLTSKNIKAASCYIEHQLNDSELSRENSENYLPLRLTSAGGSMSSGEALTFS